MSKGSDNLILQSLLAFQFTPAAFFESKRAIARSIASGDIDPIHLARLLSKAPKQCLRAADAELEEGAKFGIQHVSIFDAAFPNSLRNIDDPPLVLSCKARADLQTPDNTYQQYSPPRVALVGTRECSSAARKVAWEWGAELTRCGVEVVSGLARGVDYSAHRGALSAAQEVGNVASAGAGVAVIANGLLELYPPEHSTLAAEMTGADGIILSEAPLRARPEKHLFPRRNRIVSGLSSVIVIVEAPKKSGALITARLALEQGREVLVVPGPLNDRRCEGSNELLRDGARPALSAKDIIDALPSWEHARIHNGEQLPQTKIDVSKHPIPNPTLSNSCGPILAVLKERGESTPERISESTGIELAVTLAALTELELANLVEPGPGSTYQLI